MNRFDRPIPGQSLTDTPRNAPWERPPEFVEVGDVVAHYINQMADEDIMDDMAAAFNMGANVNSTVNAMIKFGTMNGLHTLQAGMLAGPSIGAFIKAAMSTYGIDAKEEQFDKKDRKAKRAEQRITMMIKDKLETTAPEAAPEAMPMAAPMAAPMPMPEMVEEAAPVEQMPEEMPMPEEASAPMGLMARE